MPGSDAANGGHRSSGFLTKVAYDIGVSVQCQRVNRWNADCLRCLPSEGAISKLLPKEAVAFWIGLLVQVAMPYHYWKRPAISARVWARLPQHLRSRLIALAILNRLDAAEQQATCDRFRAAAKISARAIAKAKSLTPTS